MNPNVTIKKVQQLQNLALSYHMLRPVKLAVGRKLKFGTLGRRDIHCFCVTYLVFLLCILTEFPSFCIVFSNM